MSSARMLLATVASGLAACAHTPTPDFVYPPAVNAAAPVLMVNETIPPGFNDHVVVIVDHQGLARASRQGNYDPSIRYYLTSGYTYPLRPHRPHGSTGGGSSTGSGSSGSAGSSGNTSSGAAPAGRRIPRETHGRRSGSRVRH